MHHTSYITDLFQISDHEFFLRTHNPCAGRQRAVAVAETGAGGGDDVGSALHLPLRQDYKAYSRT